MEKWHGYLEMLFVTNEQHKKHEKIPCAFLGILVHHLAIHFPWSYIRMYENKYCTGMMVCYEGWRVWTFYNLSYWVAQHAKRLRSKETYPQQSSPDKDSQT